MKAKYDNAGYRLDLDSAKAHIHDCLDHGLSKEKVKEMISKWAAYHKDEQTKLLNYLKTIKQSK